MISYKRYAAFVSTHIKCLALAFLLCQPTMAKPSPTGFRAPSSTQSEHGAAPTPPKQTPSASHGTSSLRSTPAEAQATYYAQNVEVPSVADPSVDGVIVDIDANYQSGDDIIGVADAYGSPSDNWRKKYVPKEGEPRNRDVSPHPSAGVRHVDPDDLKTNNQKEYVPKEGEPRNRDVSPHRSAVSDYAISRFLVRRMSWPRLLMSLCGSASPPSPIRSSGGLAVTTRSSLARPWRSPSGSCLLESTSMGSRCNRPDSSPR